MGTNTVRSIFTFVTLFVLALIPTVGRAQDTVISMPSVLPIAGAADEVLAQELDTALRQAIRARPGWVMSSLDIRFTELIRACNGEVETPSDTCLIGMMAARDPVALSGYVIFAGLGRRGEADAAQMYLTMTLINVETRLREGLIEVEVERIISLEERNRLATDWVRRLARLVEPEPVPPVIPLAASGVGRVVTILGIDSVEGDDSFAYALTGALRTQARTVPDWAVSDREIVLTQLALAHDCEPVTLDCLRAWSVDPDSGANGDIIIYGRLRRAGEGTSLHLHLELALFDATAGRITHRVSRDMTVEEVMAPTLRTAIATEIVTVLTGAENAMDESPIEETEVEEIPVATGNPHEGLEIGGIAMMGLGAASVVLASVFGGLIMSANDDARFNAYRSTWDGTRVSDICTVAASDMSADGQYVAGRCNEAATYEILTPLLWILAGSFATTGMFMLTHPGLHAPSESERPTVSLTPSFGPTGGSLAATVHF